MESTQLSLHAKISRIFSIISLYSLSIIMLPIMGNYGFGAVFDVLGMAFVAIFMSEMIIFLLLYILIALIAAAVISTFSGRYYSQVEGYAVIFWLIAWVVVILAMAFGWLPYNAHPRYEF